MTQVAFETEEQSKVFLQAAARKEAQRRREQEALAHYEPHDKGILAHQDLSVIRAISGGNRSGKSTFGATEFCYHMTGEYPKWYPPLGKFNRPIKGRLVATDFRKGIGEVIMPKLKEYLPHRSLVDISTQDKIWIKVKVKHKQGWVNEFDLMSNEQDTRLFEGWDGDLVWFDEPPKRNNYIAVLRGLMDRGGRVLMTFTPLEEVWIYDEIILKSGPEHKIKVFIFDIMDNVKNLSVEFIKWFENQLDEDEKEARMHGKFKFLSGLIYKIFEPSVHIVDNFTPSDDWPRAMILDPHDKYPFAMGWGAVDPTDDIWVYDEWPDTPFEKILSTDYDFKDYARIIRNKEGRQLISKRIIDPNFGNKRYGNTGRTCKEELSSFGFRFEDAVDGIEQGHIIVKEYLKYDRKRPVSSINKPKLHIMRRCENHWRSMSRYGWKPTKTYTERNSPEEIFKHFCDLIRYACMAKLKYHTLKEFVDAMGFERIPGRAPIGAEPKWVQKRREEMALAQMGDRGVGYGEEG